jgi:peptidoglycan-associated lipoprotein
MKFRMLRLMLVTGVLASSMLATGCAKKAVQAPPTPPPAPSTEEKTPTPPTPPKEDNDNKVPTPGGTLSSSDFQPAFFDYDSYTLREDARGALDQDAKLLRDNPNVKITIEGHCDERGTDEYNQALGEKRAQAARDYLVKAGIQTARLSIISYGKERPFDPGHDEAAWSKNRRAHFTAK